MKTLQDIANELQTALTDLQTIIATPVAPTSDAVIEVDTKTQSGVEETFVPQDLPAPEVTPTV